jgi:selenide,water dikinase
LSDPQTGGRLLASVPADTAGACVAALRQAGHARTAIIGEVLPQGDQVEPISGHSTSATLVYGPL